MTRDISTEIRTAIASDHVQAFFAVDLLFDDPNKLYFWSGLGAQTIDGIEYTGAGDLLGVSEIQESSDLAAYGATLTLSGIPSNLITLAKSEPYHGRKCLVKFGMVGVGAGGSLDYSAPSSFFTAFSGKMDQMEFNIGPSTSTISLNVESNMIDLRKPRLRRYTDENQQSRHSGDVFFEFVTRLQNESLEWAG